MARAVADEGRGRIMGVDVGSRRIGLALSDATRTIAQPLRVIEATGCAEEDARRVAEIGRLHGVETFVVGLPKRLTGEEGIAAKQVAHFASALEKASGKRVVLWDERLTTAEAEKAMAAELSSRQRRGRVDMVAASIMLQNYLDAHNRPQPRELPGDDP